jgi:hypothetical protein
MQYAIKTYGRVEVQIHVFLTLASTSIPFTKIHYSITLNKLAFSMKRFSVKIPYALLASPMFSDFLLFITYNVFIYD